MVRQIHLPSGQRERGIPLSWYLVKTPLSATSPVLARMLISMVYRRVWNKKLEGEEQGRTGSEDSCGWSLKEIWAEKQEKVPSPQEKQTEDQWPLDNNVL